MMIWILVGVVSAGIAYGIWSFLPLQGYALVAFVVAGAASILSLVGFIYSIVLQVIRSLPVIPEQSVAVLIRHGTYLRIQGPGRMYRWCLKPLLYPFDEIKTTIPRRPVVFETPTKSILIREGIEVQAQLQMSYRVGPTDEDVYNAAFQAPDPPGWEDAIEKQVAPAALRNLLINESLSNLIANQPQLNARLAQEIRDRIGTWGFEVQWVQMTNFHVPPEISKAVLSGMQLRSISEKISEAARERLQVIRAALAQGLDPRQVVTPNDILILRYVESLEKLGESPATKFVLPYDLIESVRGLREVLELRQPGAIQPAAPAGAPAAPNAPRPAPVLPAAPAPPGAAPAPPGAPATPIPLTPQDALPSTRVP